MTKNEYANFWYHKNKERVNAKRRGAYQKQKATILSANAKWRSENRAKLLDGKKKYYRDNKADWQSLKAKARVRAWNIENAERLRALKRELSKTPKYMAMNAQKASRRRTAKVEWADKAQIDLVYLQARDLGMAVDHIIPLKHPLVCGLHVESNLQLLPKAENSRKKNYFEVV